MKIVIKNHEMYDVATGNRVQSYYGSDFCGVDFQDIKTNAVDGTEYNITNIWDKWQFFDPQENNYTTMIKSRYLHAEKTYEPTVELTDLKDVIESNKQDNIVTDQVVIDNGDSGNSNNYKSSGISDSDVCSSIQEQSDISDTVSENNSGEHTDIGKTETVD